MRIEPAILRPAHLPSADRGGGNRTIPLVGPGVGSTQMLNGITVIGPGAQIPLHLHNCEESVIVLEGAGVAVVDGAEHEVGPGDTTWIPPGMPHFFRNASNEASLRIFWTYADAHATRTLVATGETRPVAGRARALGPSVSTPRVFAGEELQGFIARALVRAGLPEADAVVIAGLMLEADLVGADAHGIFRLPQYVRRLEAGGVNKTPAIAVERTGPATAVVDGDNGMGHLVVARAAETAIALARECGVAWVGTRRSNHAGPASIYAAMPVAAGMIGLYSAVASANHMAPWGGTDLLLGTNPLAIGIPAGEEPPGDPRYRHYRGLLRHDQVLRAARPATGARLDDRPQDR